MALAALGSLTRNRSRALGLAATLLLAACRPTAEASEDVGVAQSPVFTNGDFELGAAGTAPQGWTVATYLNSTGVATQTPQKVADLQLAAGGAALTTEIAAVNLAEADLGAAASLRVCRFGKQCAQVNFHSSTNYGHGKNVNALSQTMTVAPGDVDPTDSKVHIRFAIAPVLQNPGHAAALQPYYFVQVTNVTQGTVLYTDFNLSAQAGVPWKTVNTGLGNEIDYVDWTLVDIAPGGTAINQGDQIRLDVIASGCQPGGHFGEVYVDGIGSAIPGLFVSGTGPAQANAGTNITYKLNYKNGSAAAETGVVISFSTPSGTTFQSTTLPAGISCTPLAVGAAGTIACTVSGALAAGGTGSMTVTVNIAAGTTGQIVEANYSIHSTQETTLLGSKIVTTVGCTTDAVCPAGNWCNEAKSLCVPTLANGTPVPTDGPHTNPTLNGTCLAGVGPLVCTSGACDSDNACGYANGDGACTPGAPAPVCRSGVCDTDKICGYANGNGTCTPGASAAVCRSGVCDTDKICGYATGDGPCNGKNALCRSGACSTNTFCMPTGGCNVDADCKAGNWCNEFTNTCTPVLANGVAMPVDTRHASPTLDGTCTKAAGTLVCQSGACDSKDNTCGFADGDGPCNGTNSLCRSGACSANTFCEPAGGCNVDADCKAGNWCNESTNKCTPVLLNGTAMPTDAPHTNPTLDGTCSKAAGTLVCQSGVCDTKDSKCGFADGDGPCNGNEALCRSGACSVNTFCMPASGCNVDADCKAGNWCNESTNACTPVLANGTAMPKDAPHTSPTLDGTCKADAATLVCRSAVCDTKDSKCGFANGDGPCTSANADTVCRSGKCGVTGALAGLCVACLGNSDCSGSTPICAAGACVQCTDASQCSDTSPICDVTSFTCAACTGDNGTSATEECPAAQPFCVLSGTTKGTCGKCTTDADCTGHPGTTCDAATGLCIVGCFVDADCPTSNWCNAVAPAVGTCDPKLANGTALPSSPATVATCTDSVGSAVCKSGICDPKDNACGLALGDAPCANNAECRNDNCDSATSACKSASCTSSSCPSGDYCKADAACAPKQADGASCTGADQCKSNTCLKGVCGGPVVGSGNGVASCSAAAGGNRRGDVAALVLGILVASATSARRRRRR